MFSGLRPLRDAEGLFRQADYGELNRAALAAGLHAFWGAYVFRSDWPPDVRERADDLIDGFFRHGPIDRTADRLSDDEARGLIAACHRFIDDAESLARNDAAAGEPHRSALPLTAP